ncbi:hypothetical protein F5887DRAFT_298767 [Amanita rubescens]|nr:hypothetical protein F5887DRAFT_298767 [Amanita rubescens]
MPPHPRYIVSTLCSKRLQPSDCVDISGSLYARIRLPCGFGHLRYSSSTNRFPPNTRGFFYYHTPPKAPPLVGELRFRCASNLDDFRNGKDLVLKDKFTPWSISLYALANLVTLAKWGEQLVLDNHITQATLDKWVTAKNVVRDAVKVDVGRNRPVLYCITQPFVFRFNTDRIAFYTATKDEIGGCSAKNPLRDSRSDKSIIPYEGSGLVRFEPFVNPKRPEQDLVALRVLKIIEPVKALSEDYDGYIHQPTEGALIQRSNIGRSVVEFRLNESLKAAATLPLNFDDLP